MVTYSEIQHPRLKGEKAFQDFCLKLLRAEWDDGYARLHGRRGQGQNGADITGADNRNGFAVAACQCKGSEKNEPRQLTEGELEDEVKLAKSFEPKLDLLIVAYAGDRDAVLQKKAIALDKANREAGLFKVELWSWDDIVDRAESHPDVKQALLIENRYVPASTVDPRRPQNDIASAISDLQHLTKSLQSSLLGDTPSAIPVDAVAEAKIDLWRDQIQAGNGRVVIEPLRAFISALDAATNPHVRFRAHANLGAALEQSGERERAAVEFEEAAKAEPGTAASHAYKARALLSRGRGEEAYREAEAALNIDVAQLLGGLVLISAAAADVQTADIEARLEAIRRNPDIAAALASRYAGAGDHEDALRIARDAEVKETAIPRGMAIATAILSRFENNEMARIGATLADDDQELIDEAIIHLEKAWAWAKSRDDTRSWAFVGANLATAYRLRGDQDQADATAIEAHAIAPDFGPLIERKIIAFMHQNHRADALALANGYADQHPEAAQMAADVSAWAQDWQNLEKRALAAYDLAGTDEGKVRAAELHVLSLYRLKGEREALEKAASYRTGLQTAVSFEATTAEIARRTGDPAEIEAAMGRLAAFDRSTLNPVERIELAGAYADAGEWSTAAELLDGLYATDRPSHPLRQRLFFLYRADHRSEARTLYESLTGKALTSVEILNLGAAIYERSGMLPQAIAALEAAHALAPDRLGLRLDWAKLCIRNNNEKKFSKWIKAVPIDQMGTPDELMELAQLLDRYGRRPDALALAYRTMTRNWGHSERLHMMFMSLFLLRSRSDRHLETKIVAQDCVFVVENERKERRRYLIDEGAQPSPEVIGPAHPIAVLATGKSVGDVIEPQPGLGPPEQWTIVSIRHKIVDLFQKVMETHDTTFPGSGALGRFHVDPGKENGFEPVFEQARMRARLVDDATALYQEHIVPVDAIAKIIGIDSIDASRGLRFRSNVTLDSCVGTAQERQAALKGLADLSSIIVDPLTLSIWQEIGLLPVLEALGNVRICVVQSTIDVLAERASESEQQVRQKGGSLEAVGDKVHYVEPSKADRQAQADRCKALLEWSRAHTVVIPTEVHAEFGGDDSVRIMSRAGIDTLATAAKTGIPVILEDRRLRILATSIGILNSGWTQILLMRLIAEGIIIRTTYVTLICALHRQRVGFITVGADDLLCAVSGEVDDQIFPQLLSALSLPTVEVNSLLEVLSGFLCELWCTPGFVDTRGHATGSVLEVVISRRDWIDLTRRLLVKVYYRLSRLPFPLSMGATSWDRYIDGFLRGHFIDKRLIE